MNLYGLKVIDFHSHFPVQRPGGRNWRKRLVDRYGEERADIILENSKMYRNKWRRMWAFEPPEEGIVHNDREQAQRWVDDMDAKGLPGKKIVADYYNILKGMGSKQPYHGYVP